MRLLLVALCCAIASQVCYSQYEYQKLDKNNPNRYEGQKSVNVNAPDLELISFTAYREEIQDETDVTLCLSFYMPEDTLLFINAKEITPLSYYLMQPTKTSWKKGWNIFHPWPTSAVLNPLKIELKNIGVKGRLYNQHLGSGYLVPILLYQKHIPDTINQYDIWIKPKYELSQFNIRVFKQGETVPILDHNYEHGYASNRSIPIALKLHNQPEGYYIINIRCRNKGKSNGPIRTYHFYHQPIVSYDSQAKQ